MRVETTVDADGREHKHYIGEPGEHLFVPGPVTGIMQLADGTQVNVTPDVISLPQEQASELNDLIVDHWVANGHPDDIEMLTDPETGALVPVQRPFVGVKSDGSVVTGVGPPVGEHPLDAQPADEAAPVLTKES
jgi:hypothetical protein